MSKSTTKSGDGNVRRKNKALIFQAAKTEFVTHGFKGASIKRIAERANLPRANIHYYFKDKTDLYQQLLNQILESWNEHFDSFDASDDAQTAISEYIRAKVMYSMTDPEGSRIFASEIIHGAPHLQDYLAHEFRDWVRRKVKVIDAWIMAGKIRPVDPLHLLFLIWSSTQHYADFSVQVTAAMGKKELVERDFELVVSSLTSMILAGCEVR